MNMQPPLRFQKLNGNMEKVEANLPPVSTALIMMSGRQHRLHALPVTPQALSGSVLTLCNVQLLHRVERWWVPTCASHDGSTLLCIHLFLVL